MLSKYNFKVIIVALILFVFASTSFSNEANDEAILLNYVKKMDNYLELIVQVKEQKQNATGYEKRALAKHLIATEKAYRNLLYHFVDDLQGAGEIKTLAEYVQLALTKLKKESDVIKKGIEQNDKAVVKLENLIIDAKKNIFTINQSVGKDRLSELTWKLYRKRILQEELYSALIENSHKIKKLEKDNSSDFKFGIELVKKQAHMLSGLIILNKEKLLKLKKKLSVVRNESETGKKLISEIALKNLEIQDYANRLQSMADLLVGVKVDASLYKKNYNSNKKQSKWRSSG